MHFLWPSKPNPVCPHCQKQQNAGGQTVDSRMQGMVLKTLYIGGAVVAFFMVHVLWLFMLSIAVAFMAVWADNRRSIEFMCSSCNKQFKV